MPEKSRLRIVGRRVELDATLARTLLAGGITQLAVDADQLRVRGEFALPGGRLHLRCREMVGSDAIIDVSGRTPPTPWSEASAASGTAPAVDGQRGQDGVAGVAGGVVRIVCQRVRSAPRLLACGSCGGDSQGGGKGVQPTTASASNGAFNPRKTGGRFGGRVLKKFGLSYFLSVAYGEPGHDGARGGDGGPPGRPGRGGDGGTIDVTIGEALPAALDTGVEGGPPGGCAAPGKGAKGGDAGLGGQHRLYRYQWFKDSITPLLGSRAPEAAWARRTFGLASRAASGKAGADGSDSDVRLTAAAGAPGVRLCQTLAANELAVAFDADFLRQAKLWAEQARTRGDAEAAAAIARWALSLVEANAATAEATSLRQALQQLLSQIESSPVSDVVPRS
ncbi:hypothetical protein [Candidatus Accumulibacter sp. ACC003]|uniref:hypothetical protein n=1 Tax=Candidatus Accumulibacter sp. ACC003 TaxID=2823334 RepID=UPI0025C465A6|nr:hypothetical protein [Candidatus Accumulibacter sp. ACC003]